MNNAQNKKVEDILGSFDGINRAPAPDFFYTRLKARMEKNILPANPKSWVLRPVYAMAVLIVVILVNAAIVLKGSGNTTNNTADTESIQSIAAEYNLNDNITEEVYK
jgi:hypothetical protein